MARIVYHEVFDSLPGWAVVVDKELRIRTANDMVRDTFGEVIGTPCHRALAGSPQPCPECPALQTFEDGEEHTRTALVATPSGRQVTVMSRTRPVERGRDGVRTVVELSTPLPASVASHRVEGWGYRQRYEILFNEAPCYISVQDRKFRIIECNRTFKETFGEPQGRPCFEVYKRRRERCPRCTVARTFMDGLVHSSEETVVSKSGKTINVIVYSAPLRDAGGRVTHAMEMSTDITEIRKLESRLASLGQLVAGVSHSVKGILMGLDGGVYVVNSGFQREDQELVRKGWAMVQRNVERVSKLVQDILFYSKDRQPEKHPLVCRELVDEIHDLFALKARSHGIELTVRCSDDEAVVHADPKALHSLLVNLLENAVDACLFDSRSSQRHRIHFEVCRQGTEMLFRVTDNGIGMDKETQERAFDPQFSTKGSAGTGLGLMVAHKVATEHGGTIHVRSTPNQGTTFTVRLPLTEATSA